jgi:hypothetical protein
MGGFGGSPGPTEACCGLLVDEVKDAFGPGAENVKGR